MAYCRVFYTYWSRIHHEIIEILNVVSQKRYGRAGTKFCLSLIEQQDYMQLIFLNTLIVREIAIAHFTVEYLPGPSRRR